MAVSTGCRRVWSNDSDTWRSCCLVCQSLGTYISEVLTFFFTAEVAFSTWLAVKVTEKVIGSDGVDDGVDVVGLVLGVVGRTVLGVLVPLGPELLGVGWLLPGREGLVVGRLEEVDAGDCVEVLEPGCRPVAEPPEPPG